MPLCGPGAPVPVVDIHGKGGLTVTGADAATIERFDRLSARWQRGELALEEFADQMQRGQLPHN